MSDRRLLAACISSSVTGILVSAFIHSSWSNPTIYSDIASFWGRAWVSSGQVPYSSPGAFLEYPTISGAVLYAARVIGGLIAGVVGGSYSGYYVGFSALSLAAAALIAWSTWRLAGDLGLRVNPAYFLLPTMLVYGIYNFDLFNALFIVLCLQFFVEKRRGWSAVFLGAAIATKFVAAVLLPIFLLELLANKERVRYAATSLAATAALFVPIAIANFGYFSQFLTFYSTWPMEDAWFVWVFGSPYNSPAKFFGLVLILGLLLTLHRQGEEQGAV